MHILFNPFFPFFLILFLIILIIILILLTILILILIVNLILILKEIFILYHPTIKLDFHSSLIIFRGVMG